MGKYKKFIICIAVAVLVLAASSYVSHFWNVEQQSKEISNAEKVDSNFEMAKDLDTYLAALKENTALEHCTIFIVAKADASKHLSNKSKEGLKTLGLTSKWKKAYMKSYCAVIEDGKVVLEKTSSKKLTHEGTFGRGHSYSIMSAGSKVGRSCSVIIDGTESAKRHRGLNFVVFSDDRGSVINSVCFDTFRKPNKFYR